MNTLSNYRQHYRLHHAYSRYPKLHLAVEFASTACLLSFVAASAWFGYSAITHQPNTVYQAASSQVHEVAITANVSSAELTPGEVEIPAAATVIKKVPMAKPASAINVPFAKHNTTLSKPDTAAHGKIHDSDWIFLLPNDKFIIQFGSSPDLNLVYAEATVFPTGPVAIFPFKKTPSKRLVYGYASGIYNSLDEAQRAIQALPQSVIANGPWIRPVGALKKQILNLSVES